MNSDPNHIERHNDARAQIKMFPAKFEGLKASGRCDADIFFLESPFYHKISFQNA